MAKGLFIQDLELNISGEVLSDEGSLGIYSTDASLYQIKPIVIVLPKDEQDVIKALQIAKDHGMSVLPRGGGTSLAGQAIGQSMILDFSKHMNQILDFNPDEKWINVQPGIVRDELNAFLQPYGLHFAPDPATSSRANIGGMIANNASGTKSIIYGKTVDHVLELKIALCNGEVFQFKKLNEPEYDAKAQLDGIEGQIYSQFRELILENVEEVESRFPKVMRRVQGYNLDEFIHTDQWNLAKLICGSEGTLATILEAKINLEPLPRCKAVCVVHFDAMHQAIAAVNPMLEFKPAAIEILNDSVIEFSRKNLTTRRHAHFVEGNPAAVQIVEFYGDTRDNVLERAKDMVRKLKSMEFGFAYPIFEEGKDYEDVWTIRKNGLGLLLGTKGDKKPLAFIEDAAIPTEVLPEYIDRVLSICNKYQTKAAVYAHASVGVIHVRPILDLRQQDDIDRFKNISEETFELVKSYGGSWSGEHGDGLVRSAYLERYFGSKLYSVLKEVKQLFDPEGRMNPGKIIDGPPIDQNLRYGLEYGDEPIETYFKYREDGSFQDAVHMCSGIGECRKLSGGTMCPSFRATLDEEHSTRGRANALRLAMSGQWEDGGLHSTRLKEVLDLCLSCKACKSECPSNVDMAKLKSEVLQKYHDKNGINRRERFIRDSSKMAARLSGKSAALVNAFMNNSLTKSALQTFVGIDKRRSLPGYAQQPFTHWFERNYTPKSDAHSKVVLFADTYLNFHEPSIGRGAVRFLDRLGFEVLLANVGCCQRPRISNGFLRDAKKDGKITAKRLDQYLKEGLKVVVCEPSCASALIDDLPDLLNDEGLCSRLKGQVQSIDVFVSEFLKANDGKYKLKSTFSDLIVHGHCHHKALVGMEHLEFILGQVPGLNWKILETGCCGMAGAFGYEKEHYRISKKIANRELIPQLQENTDAEIIANGISCRHQIADFTRRKARHWGEVVEIEE